MNKLSLVFVLVMLAEVAAFHIFRSSPITRPAYFNALLTGIQFAMCYGGIESARWLLRQSPAAQAPGPHSDWARLWLWLGPPGGLLLILSSLVALVCSWSSTSTLLPMIVLAHAAGGSLVWLAASPEMLGQVARAPGGATSLNVGLALSGVLAHAAGILAYLRIYPAGQMQVKLIFLAGLLAYFVFYYIWAACLVWSVIFKFWKPPANNGHAG